MLHGVMRAPEGRRCRDLFRDEHGFTATSMVLSLLIALALVFTSAQVYRVSSASAEVQDVADAASLAAESQVGEFMIIARFCDAVVLSMSLTGIAVCGLGIAALCTPFTAELSKGLIDAGKKVIEARNNFADRATSALNKLQKSLPYFSAACAAGVAAANNEDSSDASYAAVALLVPSEGKGISVDPGEAAGNLVEDVGENADDIKEKAAEAEEASKEAAKAKERAFMRDCGDDPNYCMYERAVHLADMSGASNPFYSSVDAWSFSVALERAEHYYFNRAENDEPTGESTGDIARWRLRLEFYEYAGLLLEREGYVRETDDSFEANFPHLPKNTSEMRDTDLYTDKIYPISEEPAESDDEDPMPVMHVWDGCPGATGEITEYESIEYMETANLTTCPECEFTAESMGKVAAASTSIDNGFEYHYEAVANEAERYQEERAKADEKKAEVKEQVGGLFDELAEVIRDAVGRRIEVSPPGRFGAVAIVVNQGSTSAAGRFASSFVSNSGSLGPRAAVSAATLVDEGSEEGRTVINSMLDSLRQDGGVAVGALGIALDVWSGMLSAYSNGTESLMAAVESGLNQIPLASASGLGTWAAGALKSALEGVGLQPAELGALKPVLVNSAHVAEKDEGSFGQNLISIKERIIAHPLYSTDLFSSLLSDAEREALGRVESMGDSVEIASIELLGGGGPSIPVTVPIPEAAKEFGAELIQDFFDRLRDLHAEVTGVRTWE